MQFSKTNFLMLSNKAIKKEELVHRIDRDVGTPETFGFAVSSTRKCKI